MTAMLIGVGVLILLAGILAGVSADQERKDAKGLHDAITDATNTAKGQFQNVLNDKMGPALITARADALGEFIRAMPDVAETERRSKVPFLATVAASLLIIGAASVIAVDRIGRSDERRACIETAARLPLDTTTTIVTQTTTSGGTPTAPSPVTTTAPAPAGLDSSSGATQSSTTTMSPAPTTPLAPVAERTSFLRACLRAERDFGDQEPDAKTFSGSTSSTSSTSTSSTTTTVKR